MNVDVSNKKKSKEKKLKLRKMIGFSLSHFYVCHLFIFYSVLCAKSGKFVEIKNITTKQLGDIRYMLKNYEFAFYSLGLY